MAAVAKIAVSSCEMGHCSTELIGKLLLLIIAFCLLSAFNEPDVKKCNHSAGLQLQANRTSVTWRYAVASEFDAVYYMKGLGSRGVEIKNGGGEEGMSLRKSELERRWEGRKGEEAKSGEVKRVQWIYTGKKQEDRKNRTVKPDGHVCWSMNRPVFVVPLRSPHND